VDVVTIERSDEGGVEQLHGLVSDAIRAVFGVFDGLDAGVPVLDRVVVAQQVGEGNRPFDDQFRVVVEEDEEMPFAGHQTRNEVH
jgi:hypothetical protein